MTERVTQIRYLERPDAREASDARSTAHSAGIQEIEHFDSRNAHV
jgi:hypothetical protein